MLSGSTDCDFPIQDSKTLVTDRADGLLQSFVSGLRSLTEMVINIAAAIKQQPTTPYLKYMTPLRSVSIERRKLADAGPYSPKSSPPSPQSCAPAALSPNQPRNQQKDCSADGGVDDCRNNAGTEPDTEFRKQPVADERARNSDKEVADEPEPGGLG
jgi:hypothetical protein